MIEILRAQEAGMKLAEVYPRHDVSEPILYAWISRVRQHERFR